VKVLIRLEVSGVRIIDFQRTELKPLFKNNRSKV